MLRMLQRLQASAGLAVLYMSVDLAPVALLAHDAAFMERGSWVEVSRGAAFGASLSAKGRAAASVMSSCVRAP